MDCSRPPTRGPVRFPTCSGSATAGCRTLARQRAGWSLSRTAFYCVRSSSAAEPDRDRRLWLYAGLAVRLGRRSLIAGMCAQGSPILHRLADPDGSATVRARLSSSSSHPAGGSSRPAAGRESARCRSRRGGGRSPRRSSCRAKLLAPTVPIAAFICAPPRRAGNAVFGGRCWSVDGLVPVSTWFRRFRFLRPAQVFGVRLVPVALCLLARCIGTLLLGGVCTSSWNRCAPIRACAASVAHARPVLEPGARGPRVACPRVSS